MIPKRLLQYEFDHPWSHSAPGAATCNGNTGLCVEAGDGDDPTSAWTTSTMSSTTMIINDTIAGATHRLWEGFGNLAGMFLDKLFEFLGDKSLAF